MSIEKKYLKSKPVCKVKFVAPKELTDKAKKIYLAAEFNDWQFADTELKKQKNGDFATTIDLEPGEYAYRYVLDGELWENDFDADKYVPSGMGVENSVVVV
jgi:1,4-alpha-glucan branching enzyme